MASIGRFTSAPSASLDASWPSCSTSPMPSDPSLLTSMPLVDFARPSELSRHPHPAIPAAATATHEQPRPLSSLSPPLLFLFLFFFIYLIVSARPRRVCASRLGGRGVLTGVGATYARTPAAARDEIRRRKRYPKSADRFITDCPTTRWSGAAGRTHVGGPFPLYIR